MPRGKGAGTRVWLSAHDRQGLERVAIKYDLPADPATIINYLLGFIALSGIRRGESITLSPSTRDALSTLAHRWGCEDDPEQIISYMIGYFLLPTAQRGQQGGYGHGDVGEEKEAEMVFDVDW